MTSFSPDAFSIRSQGCLIRSFSHFMMVRRSLGRLDSNGELALRSCRKDYFVPGNARAKLTREFVKIRSPLKVSNDAGDHRVCELISTKNHRGEN